MSARRQRGVALLTVLLLVAVMAVLVVAMLDDIRFGLRRAGNAQAVAQARWHALGAEALAMAQIERLARRDPGVTTLTGGWNGRSFLFPVDDGVIRATLSDATACFNLNSVVHGAGELFTRHETGIAQYQALLLALSNPYRFAQREQDELHALTRALASQIHPSEQRRGEALLAIPLDADRGPGYIPEEREGEAEARMWLDLQPLRELLEQPLQSAGDSVSLKLRGRREALVAPADLLRRLRAGWGTAAERRNTRLDAEHSLQTVIGLSGLHFYLAGEQDFDTFMREVRGVGVQEGERASWAHGSNEAVRAGLTRARVLDQSLGGYRLLWTREETVRVRVGELIGLAVGQERQLLDWMVGVVRWLRPDYQIEKLGAKAPKPADEPGVTKPA